MALIDGLEAYYAFDGDVTDSHNSNDLTNDGGTFSNAEFKLGTDSVLYTGSTTHSDNTSPPIATGTTDSFSINVWFKRDGTDSTSVMWWQLIRADDEDCGDMRFTAGTNTFFVFIRKDDGTSVSDTFTWAEDTNWHMLTYVYNGSTVQGYLDGVSMELSISAVNHEPITKIVVGNDKNNGNPAEAWLDGMGWWSKALSQGEIDELYNSGSGLAYPFVFPPVAEFSGTPLLDYAPVTVVFSDESTETPTSWSWDFGDGVGTSSSQNPSYEYVTAGSYTVSLTATNADGSDEEIKTGYVVVVDLPENENLGTSGSSDIITRYPVVQGLVARTTKLDGVRASLDIPKSVVPLRNKTGL